MTDSVHLACLYMKDRPGLRRFLTRMTGSLGMADDLIQDAFSRVLEKEGGMAGVRDPRAYLRRSARTLRSTR
ncbi:sigma-70-like protein [Paracoccus pantotrophus]|nr:MULTISPECIES: sigma factor [Paracoccus]MDF3906303.1 sigma factor [Paracoccus sp. AS002]RKS42627.1 sigma-70-like protein [Paracoccus pantotrophus]